jgi:glycosyltransferase involved in cell wall biosynthesis
MREPLVSVIMPIKNSKLYVGQALQSVAAQTFEHCQIIVVDGGTGDEESMVRAFPRTVYIPQQGTGLAQAWNRGLQAAEAPLIAFLDSDDLWVQHKLASQVEHLARYPSMDCVIGRVSFFLEKGHARPKGFNAALLQKSHVAYMPGTAMIRREVFQRLGQFDERFQMATDIAWFANLRRSGLKIGTLDDVLLHKRIHSNNLSYLTAFPVYRRELAQILKESLDRRRQTEIDGL